jgi:long-chain acyl-CoA synthetase
VLTHDNLLYEADSIRDIGLLLPDDIQLFFLPLAHSFGQCLLAGWMSTAHIMAFAENMTTIRENMGEVRPTIMCAVPRVFEKFYAAVVAKGTAAGGTKAKLFNAAAELSAKRGEAERKGQALGMADAIKWALLKKLVFKKIGKGLNDLLGGRMRAMVSGAAPLSPKIAFFFRDAGVIILEGYGLTESSAAASVNRPSNNRIGTVGVALPGCEFKIAPDGEILIKGRNIMKGYWNNPQATDEVLKDGWLHTGDIGVIDPDGSLRITDRKKDIIVTAGGKNVAPQNLENILKMHKLISQAVIHGDKRKFLTALVTLDADALKAVAAERNLPNGSAKDMAKLPEIEKIVQGYFDETNSKLASYETIKKFKILDTDFSIESGELTPSLKVKRKVINERYKHLFEQMYEGAGGD